MKKLIMLALTAMLVVNAYAGEPKYCNPPFSDNASKIYPNAVKSAKVALKGICDALSNQGQTSADGVHDLLVNFHDTLKKEAAGKMPDLMTSLDFFSRPLFKSQDGESTVKMPEVKFFTDPDNPEDQMSVYASGSHQKHDEQVIPREIALKCFNDNDCRTNLKEYRDLLFTVYNPFRMANVIDSQGFITVKDKEWMKFIDKARSQTFIDIGITSLLYKWQYGKSENDFQSPPKVQWFALHPSVIIENVKSALDGQQTQESLALEVIGFNYWENKCFSYACGASLIVNYSDRAGVADQGWGFMFHVDNSYSFGFTKHSGKTGLFVTADLLKLFQDKKNSFQQYKDKYRITQQPGQ